jgi:LCCL domain
VTLGAMRNRPGSSFIVQVVGSASGAVWGSGAYTDDSSIAAAAVHAGLLKPGELGFVRVTVEPGRDSYEGSERNGIKTNPYGKFDGTFRLGRVSR